MPFINTVRSIQADATKNGGSYVHYSQSLEPTATLINMLPHTNNGICQALAAKWIAEHANDSSLWNWIFVKGTTNVKQSAIGNLMINFTESVVQTGKLANASTSGKNNTNLYYQDFVTTKYLSLYGLRKRAIVQDSVIGSMSNQLTVGSGTTAGRRLARRLNEKSLVTKGGGSYVLISIMGKGGGHAMAAYVGTDIAFFDPNFGEFWFPTHKQFYNFFLTFWKKSGYDKSFGSYYLLPYAKAA